VYAGAGSTGAVTTPPLPPPQAERSTDRDATINQDLEMLKAVDMNPSYLRVNHPAMVRPLLRPYRLQLALSLFYAAARLLAEY
jgi:hypothetical protein